MIKTLLLLAAVHIPVFGADIKQPEPAPLPPPIAAPRDVAYAGPIELTVDVTDVQRRVMNIHETIPVPAGELVLLYPEWIPGDHSPTGPIEDFAGLKIDGNGNRLTWTRDRVDVYAFHVNIPAGVSSINVEFQYLSPLAKDEGHIFMSTKIVNLEWASALLYPAGYFSRRIEYDPTIVIPNGWKFATALESKSREGNRVHFARTALNTLVDSPVYAGANYKQIDLTTGPDNVVRLDLFGDTPESIVMKPEIQQLHKNLAVQAQKLFASHHYNHYDFLFELSNTLSSVGLEHHQSSEDGLSATYLTKWDENVAERDLLAHEYTHSWNGKFRRPADLWTANFSVPMQDDLLWVYEGLTEYWGFVLTSRAGLRTADETRDLIARVAANFEVSPGRKWRPLVDTTNQPTISQRRPVPWVSWLRPEDYYTEGMLIWLDADTKIRELSGNKKSLDDFAKKFYGIQNGSFVTNTYKFEDVVAALNAVQPYDWGTFLKTHVYELHPEVPEDGITRGGYRLTYNDVEPEWVKKARASEERSESFATSLGMTVAKDGSIGSIWWGSPAFNAGLTSDMKITAINGNAFKLETLKQEIVKAEKGKDPIQFLLRRGDAYETISVDYHGGLRIPKLERVDQTANLLDQILAPVQ